MCSALWRHLWSLPYLKTLGVDSLVNFTPIILQSDSSPEYFVTINCPLVSKDKMTYLAFFNSRFFFHFVYENVIAITVGVSLYISPHYTLGAEHLYRRIFH